MAPEEIAGFCLENLIAKSREFSSMNDLDWHKMRPFLYQKIERHAQSKGHAAFSSSSIRLQVIRRISSRAMG